MIVEGKNMEISDDVVDAANGGAIIQNTEDHWYTVLDDSNGRPIGSYKKLSKAQSVAKDKLQSTELLSGKDWNNFISGNPQDVVITTGRR